jgi:transcriptional regulator with XRE-family HTH domain
MGRYRLGDIIRMTRKSLTITQEQLSEGICSVETLSRIENGSQNPSRDVYELLMVRMGRFRERAYSMLSVSDLKVLEKMKLFEDNIRLYNYKDAENILNEIRDVLGDSTLDRQFIIRAESLINYLSNKIKVDEFFDNIEKALLLTIPQYAIISLSNWPLSFNEVLLLINMSIAYADKEDFTKAIDLIDEVYLAMNRSYMEEQQRVVLQITIANNLSKWYGLIKKHEKAIEIAEEGMQLCQKYKLGNALPNLLYSIAWNIEQLIELGALSVDSFKSCYTYLRKAYYIASAMQLTYVEQFIGNHIKEKKYDIYVIT